MFLELVALLFSIPRALSDDCSFLCKPTETCCPGPNPSEEKCCPYENAVCCEDGINCCPEDSFCDLETRMCWAYEDFQIMTKRTGDFADVEEIPIDFSTHQRENRDTMNEISNLNHMLVHCDVNQYCPYFHTCCRVKEDNVSLCCPNNEGVCCSDEEHCCKQGEECDSQGLFCLTSVGWETMVRRSDDLTYHFEKRDLDFVQPYVGNWKPENHSE